MTDVPGHTWILPSLLAGAGVSFLHLGCNSCSTPPDVPLLFQWEGPDGSRVTTMYSRGGYGTPLLPPRGWDLPIWLALQQTSDNAGPQRAETVQGILDALHEGFPDAQVTFGSLDDFARALEDLRPELPVVKKDLADTWIHGAGSMPREVSRLRAVRNRMVALEGALALSSVSGARETEAARHVAAAYNHVLVFGEHTWGLDTKLAMNPPEFGGRIYDKVQFRGALAAGQIRADCSFLGRQAGPGFRRGGRIVAGRFEARGIPAGLLLGPAVAA